MRLFNRNDFLVLPEGTIYSRFGTTADPFAGLYLKCSGPEMGSDWIEQDLIGQLKFPDGVVDGFEANEIVVSQLESYQDFSTDLDCAGRDGCFDDSDKFVVWNRTDVENLRNLLNEVLSGPAY